MPTYEQLGKEMDGNAEQPSNAQLLTYSHNGKLTVDNDEQ